MLSAITLKKQYKKILLAISGLLLLFLVLLLTHAISLSKHKSLSQYIPSAHRRHPVSKSNISQISAWMTFDYINRVFELPDSYLRDVLTIDSKKYPSITLRRYAHEKNLDTSTLVEKIQNSIEGYLMTQHPK
ncbi:MAG: hypothetical protein KBC21_02705 [Candidatus Pacebacteria bacterium]|nr:hypothetical protein [Candidatus Paceibacterota bacterium]